MNPLAVKSLHRSFLVRMALLLAVGLLPLGVSSARPERAFLPPGNDEIDGAIAITTGLTTSLDVTTATQAGDDPISLCPSNGTLANNWYHSVWYKHVAGGPGSIHVDSAGSSYDTVISVWTGTRGNLSLLTCNDDVATGDTTSTVEVPIQAGTTYYVEVVEYGTPQASTHEMVLTFRFSGGILAWYQVADMPLDRDWLGGAGTATDVYVMGGRICPGCTPSARVYDVTAENWRYTPATDAWAAMAAMPVPMFGHRAVQLNNKIYVPSGFTALNATYADGVHRVYDTISNTWTTEQPVPWLSGAALGYYATVADPPQNQYYVIGGYTTPTAGGTYSAQMYRYKTSSHTWTTLAPMPIGRYGHSAVLIANKIYVAGGITPSACQTTGAVYDISTDTWSAIASYPLPARCFSSSVVIAGDGAIPYRWILSGGSASPGLPPSAQGGDTYSTSLVYDPNSNTWAALPGNYNSSVPRRAAVSAALNDGTTYVIGGNSAFANPDGDALLVRNERYQPFSTMYTPVFSNNAFEFADPTEPNQDFAYAYVINNGADVSGYFPYVADANDYYSFTLTTGTTFTLSMLDIDPQLVAPSSLMLYKSNRFRVVYNADPGNRVITYYGVPGTYYARVFISGSTGITQRAYRLTLTWP